MLRNSQIPWLCQTKSGPVVLITDCAQHPDYWARLGGLRMRTSPVHQERSWRVWRRDETQTLHEVRREAFKSFWRRHGLDHRLADSKFAARVSEGQVGSLVADGNRSQSDHHSKYQLLYLPARSFQHQNHTWIARAVHHSIDCARAPNSVASGRIFLSRQLADSKIYLHQVCLYVQKLDSWAFPGWLCESVCRLSQVWKSGQLELCCSGHWKAHDQKGYQR